MPVRFTTKPNGPTDEWLRKLKDGNIFAALSRYGAMGVAALASATPKEDGEAASGWRYEIVQKSGYFSIRWHNSVYAGDSPLVIMLQYGHGTGTGGYVQGRDFINPAIQPIFDQIDAEVRKAVSS